MDRHGRRLALLTHTIYGRVAWIGNVVVIPEARGRGLGAALVQSALEHLQSIGVGTIRLFSMKKAVSLYERLGFRRDEEVASFARAPEVLPNSPLDRTAKSQLHHLTLRPSDLAEALELDHRAFPGDRRAYIEALLADHPATALAIRERTSGEMCGFGFLKLSQAGAEIGPLVVRDEQAAEYLFDACLHLVGDHTVEAGIRLEHPYALRLLKSRGFRELLRALAMTWGPEARAEDLSRQVVFGGMEKG